MTQAATEQPPEFWEMEPHPHAGEVDWALVDRLWADQTLVDINDIAAMCGLSSRQSPWLWRRASANYSVNGVTSWPPTPDVLREVVVGDPQHPTIPLPHQCVLPPPDVPGSTSHNSRWYKGTIYRWGMATRRISETGEPLLRITRPSRGRGPVPGRRPRRRHA